MHYFPFLHERLLYEPPPPPPGKKKSKFPRLPYPEPQGPWAHHEHFDASLDPFAAPWWVLVAWRRRHYPDMEPPAYPGMPGMAALEYLRQGAPQPPDEELAAFEQSLLRMVDVVLGALSVAELEHLAQQRLGMQPAEILPLVRRSLETSRFSERGHLLRFLERRAEALGEIALRQGNVREAREAAKLLAQLHGLTTPANQILILNQERQRAIDEAFEIDVTPLDRPRVHLPGLPVGASDATVVDLPPAPPPPTP